MKVTWDNLHYNSRKIDGFNVPFNFVISEREAGKSTYFWIVKCWNEFKKNGTSVIILRRKITHITSAYINDIFKIIRKFEDEKVEYHFNKSDCKEGIVDVYINDKVFIRFIGMSVDITAVKSGVMLQVKYMLLDEFICNPQFGERYLKNEAIKFMEIYSTFNRESKNGIKCYFLGNPYSLYNPYFLYFGVKTSLLKPGAIISDKKQFAIECYQICDELKKQILEKNPLYQFDNAYTRYAFNGEAMLDQNIQVNETLPSNYYLSLIFKVSDKFIGIYKSDDIVFNIYYATFIDIEQVSKNRKIYAFDLKDLVDRTILTSNFDKLRFKSLKNAIAKRNIEYSSISVYYLIEEIYYNL